MADHTYIICSIGHGSICPRYIFPVFAPISLVEKRNLKVYGEQPDMKIMVKTMMIAVKASKYP